MKATECYRAAVEMSVPIASRPPRARFGAGVSGTLAGAMQDVELRSFDGTEAAAAKVSRPERYRDLYALASHPTGAIARGAGLSYCAASMGPGSVSIDMTRFNRIRSFDGETGDVVVEPGITIGALLEFLVSRNRYIPVLPGYPEITVGGCVGFDVHGKSQYHAGNFSAWVTSLCLFHPSHGKLVCSPSSESDAFELTLGGFGLTGIITEVSLKTAPLSGRMVRVERVPVRDLVHAAEVMQAGADRVECLYSWHNLNHSSARFGEGVVYMETPSGTKGGAVATGRPRSIRARRRLGYWNRLTASVAMGLYGSLQRRGGTRDVPLRAASFPIYGLEEYYRAFGPAGFREYQLIVPALRWEEFVAALRDLLGRLRVAATLASLKLFRGARRNLRFSDSGICLALDVPAGAKASELFSQLDVLALRHEAAVNISKDSRLDARVCQQIFPAYGDFRSALRRFDPERRFRSTLRERIDV
jgi:decaprenylphospho-beta-D-ribofuranose 2-oxidase